MVVPPDNSANQSFESLSNHTAGGVIVDIGTGDGRFVYQSAREQPSKFFIGIDPNPKPLQKVSMKATRKAAKGGAPNLLFVQAAIEDLPDELNGAADEIHIHFPWGSLLQAIATGDGEVLRSLYRISAPGCLLEVIIGLDPKRDRSEIGRLNLPSVSTSYIESDLASKFEAAGFCLKEYGTMFPADWPHLKSSWARRLQGNAQREVVYFIAEARK